MRAARRARGTQESGNCEFHCARDFTRIRGWPRLIDSSEPPHPALGVTLVALSALVVFPASLPAAAEPPLTVAEARELINELQTDAAGIDQQYTDVKEQINEGRAELRLKQADVQAQTEKVGRLKLQVGQIALAQFQNRNLDTVAHLFVTPDTEGFLSQISTVQKVSENQNSALQDYQQAQANLAALEHSAETDLAALGEKEKQLKSLTAASDKKLDQAKNVLAKLTADQRSSSPRPRRRQQQRPMRRAGLRRRRPQRPMRRPGCDEGDSKGQSGEPGCDEGLGGLNTQLSHR